MQDEVIIVGVCFWTVAEEIQVLTGQFPFMHIFQYDNTILHNRMVLLETNFGGQINGSKIHKHQQLSWLQVGSEKLIVLALEKTV